MKLKFSERIIDYFVQALFIFVSVFLAFWLSNYQAEQENVLLTKNVKEALKQELTANLKRLELSEPFMKGLVNHQNHFYQYQRDTVTRFDLHIIPQMKEPFNNMVLSNGAATLVNDSSVKLHPYVKTRIYANYKEQELVMKAQTKLFNDFLTSSQQYDPNLVKENYTTFFSLANDLHSKQNIAIFNLKEVIKMINN